MGLSFNSIPANIRTPGSFIEFDNSRAVAGLPGQPMRALIIGQRLTAGTIAQNIPKLIGSKADGEVYFGRGSMISAMIDAFKDANPHTELWAVGISEAGGGAAAVGSLAFAGPATAAGTLFIYIAGELVQVAVASGDTANTIAANAIIAINEQTDLPVTALVDGTTASKVNLTCRWKGTTGNKVDLRFNYQEGQLFPAGVTCTITAMASGTTDPTLAATIAALGPVQYNTIVSPYADATNLGQLEVELLRRWGPTVLLEGQAFVGACDTLANLSTLGESRNSQFLTIMGGGQSPTAPWVWAAVAAAVDSAEPDPARPRQTLPLTGVLPPARTQVLDRDERDILLNDGISTFVVDAGGQVLVERLITTYQLNAQSVPDVSYLDITTMRTLAYLRFAVRARISSKYPRHKLASDGTAFSPGQAIVTPSTIRAELIVLFLEWEKAGLVEDFDQFKTDLQVVRNDSDANRVDALLSPNLINQFTVFAGQIQFLL